LHRADTPPPSHASGIRVDRVRARPARGKTNILSCRKGSKRASEGLSEGIRRIHRGLPEEEPSATAERIASREIGRVAKKHVTFRRAAKGYTWKKPLESMS
jgi:hypothetical protein